MTEGTSKSVTCSSGYCKESRSLQEDAALLHTQVQDAKWTETGL